MSFIRISTRPSSIVYVSLVHDDKGLELLLRPRTCESRALALGIRFAAPLAAS
jgi:hypothetical protein